MEGNYNFTWTAVSAAGIIEGQYEQTLYGETLMTAISYFESFHGPLSPDENGVCLVITGIAWGP